MEYILKKINQFAMENSIVSIREILFERVLAVFCVFGLIVAIIGSVQAYSQGKMVTVFFYVTAYMAVLICFFLRKKIPHIYLTNIVLADVYMLSILILAGLGLSGAGIPLLMTFCVLTTTFQGIKRGLVSTLMSVAAVLLIGWALNSGLLPMDIAAMNNSTRTGSWVIASVMALLTCSIMVVCLGVLQESLQRTIKVIQKNAVELQGSNKQLETSIKHQKKTAKKLMESKSLLEAALESTADGILVIDKNGCWTEFNQKFKDIWHIPEAILDSGKNKKALKYFIENIKNPEPFISQVRKKLENKEKNSFDILKLKDGRTLELYSNPQRLDQKIVGRVWSFRDITDQRNLESRLQLSQRMDSIGTLAGGIAHDFNNILFPIIGHTEMLLEDAAGNRPFQSSLNQIYSGALRAKDLVNQILTLSRQDNHQLRPMKIQPVLNEALKLIRSTIPAMIKINQDIRSGCGAIMADPTQIHQIVMNLATNAYHAMEASGGELNLTLKEIQLSEHDLLAPDMKPGAYACLSVKDTGVGMTKALTHKIFDPFFTTKEKGKGTGLGLSVVHGIVVGTGGAVKVYSEPDKGTQFYVYFPIEKRVAIDPSPVDNDPIKGGLEKILLVDDEAAILLMEKKMLERLGYRVTSYNSSIEAIEAFRHNPDAFDLVITDMAMPNLSGEKLAGELSRIRHDIPILLCTGFSDTMSAEKADTLGIKGFLMKPIAMRDFSRKIRDILDSQ